MSILCKAERSSSRTDAISFSFLFNSLCNIAEPVCACICVCVCPGTDPSPGTADCVSPACFATNELSASGFGRAEEEDDDDEDEDEEDEEDDEAAEGAEQDGIEGADEEDEDDEEDDDDVVEEDVCEDDG